MAKIAIIGAGHVGATTAYTLALHGAAREIALIDLDEHKARGEALDIAHGMPLCPAAKVSGGGYELLDGADITVMTAGANQEPGETRRALAGRNFQVMDMAANEIVARAPDTMLIVVTNPLDALTRAAIDMTGFPTRRVMGSGTTLDTLRLRAMLADHTHIDPRNIHGFVLGEHGDSELPAWSTVSIAGMTMEEYCRDCGQCDWQLPERMREAFDGEVRKAAYRVIDMKGATYYAVSVAIRRIVTAILRDEHAILTVSSLLTGEYGIADVCLSLPCVIGRRGVERLIPLKLTPEEELMLRHSADVVRAMTATPQYS
ncbi:MAG: L-lactate dehydrogenase [Christensenellales bacterium]|jgi:L-lactate dehydrogenase